MSYRGRKVVVTGADGFIGSHVVEALVAEGAEVTALALYNSFDGYGWLDDLAPEVRSAVRLERGDVRDSGYVLHLFSGQEICFHLAALIAIPHSYEAPRSFVEVNIGGTLNVLEAARVQGLARIVHTSTSEVYGTAQREPMDETHPLQGQSPYSASKIGADMIVEAYARSFALPVVVLRPFNTFGPRQSERAVIPTIVRQALDPTCDEIRVGELSPRRDFTYVADSALAFLAIGAANGLSYGSPYNAGTGRSATVEEVVHTICAICGTNKPVVSVDERKRPEHSEVRALIADSRRLEVATGWRAVRSLEAGLELTVAWWRRRLASAKVRADTRFMT